MLVVGDAVDAARAGAQRARGAERRPGSRTPTTLAGAARRRRAARAGRRTRRGAARARPHARRRAAPRVRPQPADLDHRPTAPRASPRSSRSDRPASRARDRGRVHREFRRRHRPTRGRGARRPARPTASARGSAGCRPVGAQPSGRGVARTGTVAPHCGRLGPPRPADRVVGVHRHGVDDRRADPGRGRGAAGPHRAHRRRGRRGSRRVVAARRRGADDAGARRLRPRGRRHLADRRPRRGARHRVGDAARRARCSPTSVRSWCRSRTRSVPIPSRSASDLVRGQERHRGRSRRGPDRDRLRGALVDADLLVDGHPPRVLGNAGLGVEALTDAFPALSVLRVAAFVDGDRPGYGPAAEARGGWAARHDPPRLGRSSVADPVAGMVGALAGGRAAHGTCAGRPRSHLVRGRGRTPAGAGAVR